MDEEYQRMAAHAIAHEAFCAGQAWQQAAAAHERPCVLWKPRLFIDGNQWCALFGENIQEGVVGFGDSPDAAMLEFDDTWRKKLTSTPGAHPAPSLASDDVSLISEGKTQPAQSVKDAIIDDLQSQFDTEGITEHDSGDALIRLSDAIAAVEDNFAQPAPSVPDGWIRAIDEALVVTHLGVANASDTYEQAKAKLDSLIGFHVDVAIEPAVNGGWKLVPNVPEGFSREDLEAVADGLDGYEKTVNVGNVTGEGDDHLESTTAYAARFIRAMLAATEAKP